MDISLASIKVGDKIAVAFSGHRIWGVVTRFSDDRVFAVWEDDGKEAAVYVKQLVAHTPSRIIRNLPSWF
jgi:hypothetical protein